MKKFLLSFSCLVFSLVAMAQEGTSLTNPINCDVTQGFDTTLIKTRNNKRNGVVFLYCGTVERACQTGISAYWYSPYPVQLDIFADPTDATIDDDALKTETIKAFSSYVYTGEKLREKLGANYVNYADKKMVIRILITEFEAGNPHSGRLIFGSADYQPTITPENAFPIYWGYAHPMKAQTQVYELSGANVPANLSVEVTKGMVQVKVQRKKTDGTFEEVPSTITPKGIAYANNSYSINLNKENAEFYVLVTRTTADATLTFVQSDNVITGVSAVAKEATLYPSMVNVNEPIHVAIDGANTVQVFDLTGRVVMAQQFVDQTEFVMNRSGQYFVKIVGAQTSETRKIIVK